MVNRKIPYTKTILEDTSKRIQFILYLDRGKVDNVLVDK